MFKKSLKKLFFKLKNPCISRKCLSKFVLLKKRASQVTIYQKTCISRFFGPYSKTCTVEVRAAWGRVSRGPTVLWNSCEEEGSRAWISLFISLTYCYYVQVVGKIWPEMVVKWPFVLSVFYESDVICLFLDSFDFHDCIHGFGCGLIAHSIKNLFIQQYQYEFLWIPCSLRHQCLYLGPHSERKRYFKVTILWEWVAKILELF